MPDFRTEPLIVPTVSGLLPAGERDRRVALTSFRSDEGRVQVPMREVVCYECGQTCQVPSAALSANCIHCHTHLNMADVEIRPGSRRLTVRTLGHVHVPAAPVLSHLSVVCNNRDVDGRVSGSFRCTGTLSLNASMVLDGAVSAGKLVVDKGLDVGFAFDGDADRCLCVDEKGNVVTGDHILYILGMYMRDRGQLDNNTVVTTVMSNFGLYKAFDKAGIDYAKTQVGDKYVYEYMAKNGCRLGGEQSGHIIISKYANTGDGLLTSLKIMEVIMAKKQKLSELCRPLKIYPQVLKNIRVRDKKEAQDDPKVQQAVERVAAELGNTGRILVRESGTEPVVRVMVEAPSKQQCEDYVNQVIDVICAQGHARV